MDIGRFCNGKAGVSTRGIWVDGFSSPCSNLASSVSSTPLGEWLQEGWCGGGFFPVAMSLRLMLGYIGSRKVFLGGLVVF